MDFKKFKRDVKNENISIPSMSEEVRLHSKQRVVYEEKRYFRNKKFRLSFSFISILVLMLAVAIVSLSINNSNELDFSYKLETIKSEEDLKKVLSYANDDPFGRDDEWAESPDEELDGPASEPGASESPNDDYKDTNEQVEGVQEADIVKTDGTRIYYANPSRQRLFSYNINTGEVKVHDYVFYQEKANFSFEMYLNEKYVILIMDGYSKDYEPMVGIVVLDKFTFEEVKRYDGYGRKVDTRVIDNVLYFVYSYAIYDGYGDIEDDDIEPKEYIDNKKVERSYNEITYSKEIINRGYTYIVAMDLDTLEIKSNLMLSNSSWTNVYASKNSLYLSVTMHEYAVRCYTINGIGSETLAFNHKTVIFRYEFDGINVNYKGYISTYGAVINQFCLDEYDGYLRVALNVGNNTYGNNKLEIYDLDQLDENMRIKKVASINDGLGKPYEQIKSVRFNKNSCLIVTYHQTDPLYYIDLTDPLNPNIIAGYQEPGYNLYLHYVNDELAFGIGYDDEWNVKVGLYEINEGVPNKVYEDNSIISTGALNNHKELFVDGNIFGFGCTAIDYNNIFTQYRVYRIVEAEGTHTLQIVLSVRGAWNRMVRIADCYYLISPDGINVYNSDFIKITGASF